ncbi:MAG: hypothetical protein KDE58_21020 [Caldilineaceae bacterium]|nr:hypothetical protein [Caldilineaceae bacterium]
MAIQYAVYWIDDLLDAVYDRTQDGQALIGGQTGTNRLGSRGNGIVLSMKESGLVEPINRPDIDGRVTLGNNPIFEPGHGSVDHPQMTSAIMIADETTYPDRAGFLPEGTLISYSNSRGPASYNKQSEYRKQGKYQEGNGGSHPRHRGQIESGAAVATAAPLPTDPFNDYRVTTGR